MRIHLESVALLPLVFMACGGGATGDSKGHAEMASGSAGSTASNTSVGQAGSSGAGLPAASGDPTNVDAGAGGQAGSGPGGSSGEGTHSCNALVNDAPEIKETDALGPKPNPVGGPIVDGTYYLTKSEFYPPDTPELVPWRSRIDISANTLQVVVREGDGPETHLTLQSAATGSQVALTTTCPEGADDYPDYDYSATPDSLTLFNLEVNQVLTLTRQ